MIRTTNNPIAVLTRTENDPHTLSEQYPNINWVEFPLIQFRYLELDRGILDYIDEEMDWLVFTSQNAVKAFLSNSEINQGKLIACVGPKTRTLVESHGYSVDFVPQRYTSSYLANEIPVAEGENVCYVGGNLSNQETIKVLKDKASHFLKLEVYETLAFEHTKSDWQTFLLTNPELVSFCSPSAVKAYCEQIEQHKLPSLTDTKFAAIGSTTAGAIRKLLKSEPIVGKTHTFQGMIEEIVTRI